MCFTTYLLTELIDYNITLKNQNITGIGKFKKNITSFIKNNIK